MTATAAICMAFLNGETLSIKTAFNKFGVTNLPREVGRSVERKFGVYVSKVQQNGKSKYGLPCIWVEYRLNPLIDENKDGVEKMKAYVIAQGGSIIENKKSSKKELPSIEVNPLFAQQ